MSDKVIVSMEDRINKALQEMEEQREKINVSQVARHLGVSHSLIYKSYPEKIADIQKAQKRQKHKAEAINLGTENEGLKKIVTELKSSNAKYKAIANDYKIQNESLWEHIQQVYNMYDEILTERNGFAERLR